MGVPYAYMRIGDGAAAAAAAAAEEDAPRRKRPREGRGSIGRRGNNVKAKHPKRKRNTGSRPTTEGL